MFFIVLFHFIAHGIGHSSHSLTGFQSPAIILFNHISIELIVAITSVAVNCYVLISGYFLVKLPFKLKRITNVWTQTFFYSVIICSILYFTNFGTVEQKNIVGAFTPIRSGTYWFVTKYFGLLILSPFLSKAINSISKKEFKLLLLILSGINITFILKIPYGDVYGGSTSLLWFIFLFFIAGYIRLYDPLKEAKLGKFFFLFVLLTWGGFIIKSFIDIVVFNKAFYYFDCAYNGTTFFSSLFLFLWFKKHSFKMNFYWHFLVKTAPYTFGVYLIHDNIFLRKPLWEKLIKPMICIDSWSLLPRMFCICISLFIICLLIEYLRTLLFSLLTVNKHMDSFCTKVEIIAKNKYKKIFG